MYQTVEEVADEHKKMKTLANVSKYKTYVHTYRQTCTLAWMYVDSLSHSLSKNWKRKKKVTETSLMKLFWYFTFDKKGIFCVLLCTLQKNNLKKYILRNKLWIKWKNKKHEHQLT